jgi:hypothetical protein
VTELTHLNEDHSFPQSEEPPPFQYSSSPTLNCNNASHNLLMQSVVQFYLLRLSQENFTGTKLVVVTIQIQCEEEVTYICLGTVKPDINVNENVWPIKLVTKSHALRHLNIITVSESPRKQVSTVQ